MSVGHGMFVILLDQYNEDFPNELKVLRYNEKLKDLDKTSPFTHDDFEPDQDKSPFRVLPVLRIKPLTDEQGKKWKAAVYLLLAKSQPGATP